MKLPFNDLQVIITTCNTIIPLKYIESINSVPLLEDKVMQVLKNDIILTIRTVSGREYMLSINEFKIAFGCQNYLSNIEIERGIKEQWLRAICGN